MLQQLQAHTGPAALWLIGCTLAGFAVDQLLFSALKARGRSGTGVLREVAAGLHWLPTSLGFVFGAYAAQSQLALTGPAQRYSGIGVQVVGILAVTAFSARILGRLIRMYTRREDTPFPSTSLFVNLARGVVWTVGALSVLGTVGVSVVPLVTALGVGGLAVGLALQPTLENVFSGIQLLASRQIQPGDFIRLETGEEGTVLDVTWRNTTVHKLSNDIVLVPNSVLARASVTNFTTLDPEFVLLVPVTVASAADPDIVEGIALEVARDVTETVEGAVRESEPGVRFAEFAPPAAVLNVTVRCTSYQDRVGVRHELIRRLAKRFSDEGVEAPPVSLAGGRTRQ